MSRMCFNCMKMTEDGEFCSFCGKKLKTAPAHHLLPGTILNGKYTVGYALGEGGFGVTYIGLDNSLQIKVAIKEFFPKGIVGRNSAIKTQQQKKNLRFRNYQSWKIQWEICSVRIACLR